MNTKWKSLAVLFLKFPSVDWYLYYFRFSETKSNTLLIITPVSSQIMIQNRIQLSWWENPEVLPLVLEDKCQSCG